jgi:hypothetical protein
LGDRTMRWMEACYGGTDAMERSCAVARGKTPTLRVVPRAVAETELCSRKVRHNEHELVNAVGAKGEGNRSRADTTWMA